MTAAVPPAAFARPRSLWRTHLIVLAGVTAALLVLYARDLATLVATWWTSTTFGHCFFIPPILCWLVWQRREELAHLTPTAWWPGLMLVPAGGAGWLLGDAGSVAFARELGLVMMLQGAVVTLLGPQVARGLLFPLCYAVFLVPFGEWLEPPLQIITVKLVMPLLALAGIPATSDGVMIHAGRYYFEVAEACSGAKFVIAMAAFGVLVANVCFHSWRRRIAFLAACVIVPVLANAVRAFATIWVADLTDVETAAGFDHIVYGWIWFGLVMAATLAIGWRWFDRPADAPAFDPTRLQRPVSRRLDLRLAAALVLATAAAFPAWSAALAHRSTPLPAHLDLPDVPGWRRVPLSTRAPWRPFYPGADHQLVGRYADAAGHEVDVGVAVFASQSEGRELIAYGTGAESNPWLRVADLPPIAGGAAMRMTAPGPVERVVATWYWVGGHVTADPAAVKLLTLKARLLGGDQRAVAIHLSAEVRGGDGAAAITAYLASAGPVDRIAREMLRGRSPLSRSG